MAVTGVVLSTMAFQTSCNSCRTYRVLFRVFTLVVYNKEEFVEGGRDVAG